MYASIDFALLIIIAISFLMGYWLISFIINKIRPEKPNKDIHGNYNNEPNPDSAKDNTGRFRSNNYYKYQNQRNYGNGPNEEKIVSSQKEKHFAYILGLRGEYTIIDLKKAYHEQLARYHPDKVEHLGTEFKQIAEEKTRQIIIAYEYFRKQYGIN